MTDLITNLESLLAKATPGPWSDGDDAAAHHCGLAPARFAALTAERDALKEKLALHAGDCLSLQKELDEVRSLRNEELEEQRTLKSRCEKLEGLLREASAFLGDPRHGQWPYVENGQQAEDMARMRSRIACRAEAAMGGPNG